MWGFNKNTHFESASEEDGWHTIPIADALEPEIDSIIDICTGSHFTVFITKSGKAYASGVSFFTELGIAQTKPGTFEKLNLPDETEATRVWCSRERDSYMAIIEVKEKSSEIKYLASAGLNLDGLLG